MQKVANLAPFDGELVFVSDVLVSTAAASAKIWTRRCDAMGRAFEKIDKLGPGELFRLPYDPRGNFFAIDGERNKDSFAFLARHTFPAESDVFDG